MELTIVFVKVNGEDALENTLEYTRDTLHNELDVNDVVSRIDTNSHADSTKTTLTEHEIVVLTTRGTIPQTDEEILHDTLQEDTTTELVVNTDTHRKIIKTAHQNDVNSHDVSTGITITARADGELVDDLLETIHDHETDTRSWEGRPPFGFTVENGQLVQNDDFEDIKHTLECVLDEEITKTAAADELSCTRKTITSCLNHASRYDLN